LTGEYTRRTGDVLADIPATLPAERWTITRPGDCGDAHCDLELTMQPAAGGSGRYDTELKYKDGHYVAAIDFTSSCIDPTTRQVRERNASSVKSTYNVRTTGATDKLGLAIHAVWEGEPTAAGIKAGCTIRAAEFDTTAESAQP
jgi:hypothetical protein